MNSSSSNSSDIHTAFIQIRAIIKETLGYNSISFEPILGRGISNEVVMVETEGGKFVVRLNDMRRLSNFRKEAWCLEQAHLKGVPVPRVVAWGVNDTKAYSIARYIEDSALITEDLDQLAVWRTLGAHAAKLNSIQTVGFGTEMVADGRFAITSWEQVMTQEIELIFRDDYWTRTGVVTSKQESKLRSALERCCSIGASGGVCHWDLGCDNALVRGGNCDDIVLLDLEFAVSAPVPHYQFSCIGKSCGLSSKEMEAFSAGYGLDDDMISEIRSDVERIVVLQSMRSLRWAEDRNSDWIVRNTQKAKETIFDLLGSHIG